MKRCIGISIILAAVVSLGDAGAARAEDVPEFFRIDRIDYRGPACPPGTAAVSLVGDNTRFIVVFDTFNVQAGPDVPLTEASKFCNLVVHPSYPRGWTWTVASIAYRGNAILGDLVNGRFRARYSFPGQRSVSQDVVLPGPFLGDFELLRPLDVYTWAPCGAAPPAMTITATGQVDNTAARDQQGLLTVEQSDGLFKVVVNVLWKRCA